MGAISLASFFAKDISNPHWVPPAIVDLHKSWISLICTPAAVLSTLLPDDNGRRDEPSHPKNSHNPGQGLLNTYSSFLNFDPGTRDPWSSLATQVVLLAAKRVKPKTKQGNTPSTAADSPKLNLEEKPTVHSSSSSSSSSSSPSYKSCTPKEQHAAGTALNKNKVERESSSRCQTTPSSVSIEHCAGKSSISQICAADTRRSKMKQPTLGQNAYWRWTM